MNPTTPLAETFDKIFVTQEFRALDPYRDPKKLEKMVSEERLFFARALILEGETTMPLDPEQAIRSLDLATKAAPEDPAIFWLKARVLAAEAADGRYLRKALQAIEEADSLKPNDHDILTLWAWTYYHLSFEEDNSDHLITADRKFAEAEKVRTGASKDNEFYWRWGTAWMAVANASGEAEDYRRALELFEKAQEEGLATVTFLNDYANGLVGLASLINHEDSFQQAVELYGQVVAENPTFFEGWLNLACTAFHIIQSQGKLELFQIADAAFREAIELQDEDASIWYKWGRLLFFVGQTIHSRELLELSIKKFEKAHLLQPNNYTILGRYAEAITVHGGEEEDLSLLKKAEELILKAISLEEREPLLWYVYGLVLFEQGNYFSDERIYENALSKTRLGLSLDETNAELWYALGMISKAIGHVTRDPRQYEAAHRWFSRAHEFGGEMFPQFWNDWAIIFMRLIELTGNKIYAYEAIEKLEKAFEKIADQEDGVNTDPEWLYNYGCAWDYLGEETGEVQHFEKAVKILTQVLEVDPDFHFTHYNLAVALSHLGEAVSDLDCFRKATVHFEQYAKYDSEEDQLWNEWGMALVHVALLTSDPANQQISEKLFSAAENRFQQAVVLGNTFAFYHLACVYSLRGAFAESIHYLEKAATGGSLNQDLLLHDSWLDGVRSTEAFQQLLDRIN